MLNQRAGRRLLLLKIASVIPLAAFVLLKLAMWLVPAVDQAADPTLVTQAFRFAILWAVGVMGIQLWTGTAVDNAAEYRRRRVRRVYVWAVGVAVTAMWGVSLVETLLPHITDSVRVLGAPLALVAIWSVFIFLWLVHRGDGSPTYHKTSYLGQYRTIWTLLAATFLALVLVNVSSYQSVQDRVAGLNATLIDAQEALDRLAVGDVNNGATASELNTNAFCLLKLVDGYTNRYLVRQDAPAVRVEHPCDVAQSSQELKDQVTLRLPILRYYLLLADTQARVGLSLIDFAFVGASSQDVLDAARTSVTPGPTSAVVTGSAVPTATAQLAEPSTTLALASSTPTAIPGAGARSSSLPVLSNNDVRNWLVQPREVIQQTVHSAELVHAGLDSVDVAFDTFRRSPDDDAAQALALVALDRIVVSDVYGNTSELASQASAARNSLAAVDIPTLPVFLWVTIFYAVLLSVPSVLLLLFFIRKRDQRAAQIMDDLTQLDPTQGLLMRVLGLDSPLSTDTRDSAASETSQRAVTALTARQEAIRQRHTPRNDPDIQPIIEQLAARAFSNLEYAMALTLLTCLLGLGWYFVFYPETTAGLAMLIARRADVGQVTTYLTRASPLTYGFVGAYFWGFQMLLRRYLAGDLYPSAFLQAAERVVVVFILSLVFSIMSLVSPLAGAAAVVAFVAGVYPNAGLRQITRYANKVIQNGIFPETSDSALLTNLDGIDIWIEARLVEEKVESIQSLATAEIEMLVLRTNFPTTQIVDWIDQALLYLHAGFQGRWYSNVRMAGIRSASDLLDAAGVLKPDANGKLDPEKKPDDNLIKCIAGAARALQTPAAGATAVPPAQPTAAPAQGTAAPGQVDSTDLTNTLYVMCDALWPDPNIRYVLAYMGYELHESGPTAGAQTLGA